MSVFGVPALLVAVLLLIYLAVVVLRHRYPANDSELIEAIDVLLPQIQCAQCGYPGCRPYAEALAEGDVATNLCPPGGAPVHQALEALLQPSIATAPPEAAADVIAVIEESECIGCALCLPPCPVDAIVGAAGFMHTVTSECTGCELCIPACPVDCISLAPAQTLETETDNTGSDNGADCIQCGLCDPVCPVNLPAQALLFVTRRDPLQAIDHGLDACIECGLCSRVCPSDIDMVAVFQQGKRTLTAYRQESESRAWLKTRYADHERRLAEAAQSRDRNRRLKSKRTWR